MMATERETSCAARIPDQLSSRLETFSDITRRLQDDEEEVREDASDEQLDFPLAVTPMRVVRVDLSTGGPADWFEVFQSVGEPAWAEPDRIVYHFADWFDHAEITLEGDEFAAAWDFLAVFVEFAS